MQLLLVVYLFMMFFAEYSLSHTVTVGVGLNKIGYP